MTTKTITSTNDASFAHDVLNASQPVLVDFWAAWCGPCRALAPHLDAVAHDLAGQAQILKLDIDQNPETAAKYGVRSIPTLLVFKNGEVVGKAVGNPGSKQAVQRLMREHL